MNWPFTITITDEQAMWRVRHEDDHSAFAQLVARWETPIQRLCTRMVGDMHRAEDLTQEAFARVFAHRHKYEPAGRFSTWLWRIAINLCHDEIRRKSRRPEVTIEQEEPGSDETTTREIVDAEPCPDEAIQALEQAEQVRRALMRLPEHYRGVLVLRHYEGLKFSEIAQVLGIPEGTVKSRMSEGLARLSELLPKHTRN